MELEDILKFVNEFIIALSSLLWPIVTLIIVVIFKKDLSDVSRRIKKGKFFVLIKGDGGIK